MTGISDRRVAITHVVNVMASESGSDSTHHKRYFLFHYTVGCSRGVVGGDGNLWVESSEFPSNTLLKEKALSSLSYKPPDATVVITGWNEFKTRDDYLGFTGTTDEHEEKLI